MKIESPSGEHPYQSLTPDVVLDAVEAAGLSPSGSLLALNSYENRVYQIGLDDGTFVVAKFYRPQRWSEEAIREEHAFAKELAALDIPIVLPIADQKGNTLRRHQGFLYAVYPRQGGRSPELDDPDTLLRLGRLIGRIHAVGSLRRFAHRPTLDIESFGWRSFRFLADKGFLPQEHKAQYGSLVPDLLHQVQQAYDELPFVRNIRLHGDCHVGNILWSGEAGFHFVDLDDCRNGPAVQDLWMLLSGDRANMSAQLAEILAGYEEFHAFDTRELRLIEPLRALRIIHYTAWLARRWHDPAFPRAFPWFNTPRFWDEHILALREQQLRLAEPPLTLMP